MIELSIFLIFFVGRRWSAKGTKTNRQQRNNKLKYPFFLFEDLRSGLGRRVFVTGSGDRGDRRPLSMWIIWITSRAIEPLPHNKDTHSMVKPYIYKVGPEDVKTAPLNFVSSFFDFVNTFQYTRRERDIAMGILSVMLLAVVVLICAVRIDRDESRYIRKLQAKARKRGYKVD